MNKFVKYSILFILLVLVQVLLLNNVKIFGIGAFLYVYFILVFPTSVSNKLFMPICFLLGLSVDMFLNTYGVHAAACTATAFFRPFIIKRTVQFEGIDSLDELTFKSLKRNYVVYSLILILLHHFLLFTLQAFSLNLIWLVLLETIFSTIFTFVLLMVVQMVKSK